MKKGVMISVRVPVPLYKMLVNEAIAEGKTSSAHIRDILRKHLASKPGTKRELYDKSFREKTG